MRPLVRPSGESRTSVFPIRKRASVAVSIGRSARFSLRIGSTRLCPSRSCVAGAVPAGVSCISFPARTLQAAAITAQALMASRGAEAQVPSGYPASYTDTFAAARKEGKVVVYATTDVSSATPLNRAFDALYPDVK